MATPTSTTLYPSATANSLIVAATSMHHEVDVTSVENQSSRVDRWIEDLTHRVNRDEVLKNHSVSEQALSATRNVLMTHESLEILKLEDISGIFKKQFLVENLMHEFDASLKLKQKTITEQTFYSSLLNQTRAKLAEKDPDSLTEMTTQNVYKIFKDYLGEAKKTEIQRLYDNLQEFVEKINEKPYTQLSFQQTVHELKSMDLDTLTKMTNARSIFFQKCNLNKPVPKTTVADLIEIFKEKVAATQIPNSPNYTMILQRTEEVLEAMASLENVNVMSIFAKCNQELKAEQAQQAQVVVESEVVLDTGLSDAEVTDQDLKEMDIFDKIETLKTALSLDDSNQTLSTLEAALEQNSLQELEKMTYKEVEALFISLAPPPEATIETDTKQTKINALMAQLNAYLEQDEFLRNDVVIADIKSRLEKAPLENLAKVTNEYVIQKYVDLLAKALEETFSPEEMKVAELLVILGDDADEGARAELREKLECKDLTELNTLSEANIQEMYQKHLNA